MLPDARSFPVVTVHTCTREVSPTHSNLPRHKQPQAQDHVPAKVPEAARATTKLRPRDEGYVGGVDRSQHVPEPLRPPQRGDVERLLPRVGMRDSTLLANSGRHARFSLHRGPRFPALATGIFNIHITIRENHHSEALLRRQGGFGDHAEDMALVPKPSARRSVLHPSPFALERGRPAHVGPSALDSRLHRYEVWISATELSKVTRRGTRRRCSTTATYQRNLPKSQLQLVSLQPKDKMDTSGKLGWRETEDLCAREEQWQQSPQTRAK